MPISIGNMASSDHCDRCDRSNPDTTVTRGEGEAAQLFLSNLKERGVEVWGAPGGKLRYSPKTSLGEDDVEKLKEHKEELLRLLSEREFQRSQRSQRSHPERNPDTYQEFEGCTCDDNGHPTVTFSEPTVTHPAFVLEAEQRARAKAEALGFVARWSREFGFISIHDPTSGEWYDLPTKEAPEWAKNECFKRRELRKLKGITRLLTQAEMEEVWMEEQVEMRHAPAAGLAIDRRGIEYRDYLEEE